MITNPHENSCGLFVIIRSESSNAFLIRAFVAESFEDLFSRDKIVSASPQNPYVNIDHEAIFLYFYKMPDFALHCNFHLL
jgi:hypothetical protein